MQMQMFHLMQMRMQMPFSRNTFKCKCFGVACKCFGYTFANVFELISNVLAFLEKKQCNVYKHIINLFDKYSGTLL